jgi:hypothetical protein
MPNLLSSLKVDQMLVVLYCGDQTACGPHRLPEKLGLGDAEIAADLPGEYVADLGVPGHGVAAVVRRISPPRMLGPFPIQNTAMGRKVGQKFTPLHIRRVTSS